MVQDPKNTPFVDPSVGGNIGNIIMLLGFWYEILSCFMGIVEGLNCGSVSFVDPSVRENIGDIIMLLGF